MNLFATVLTNTAPSANYRGEGAENRAVIQKVTKGRFEYPIISPEAIRNAIRETIHTLGLPCNRSRLSNEDQPAVEFQDYPDAERFADDFFMGWLVAAGSSDRKTILKELKERDRDPDQFQFKRDSVLRANMAVALEPYRHNSVFTQSPQDKTDASKKSKKNVDKAQLLHRETAVTAFQYPFALNLNDCAANPKWTKTLLKAIGELNDVAGNHARSYFEFAPASIVVRLTEQLVAGYDTYGFDIDDDKHTHRLIEKKQILDGVFEGRESEFYFGGQVVEDMDEETTVKLRDKGVTLDRSPQRLLETISGKLFESAGSA